MSKTITFSIYGTTFRIFQGRNTKQVDGVVNKKAKASAWYWEPSDYEGDVTFSPACASARAAMHAAIAWAERTGSP